MAERKCTCTLAQKLTGDGCDVCNPGLAAELAAEAEPVTREELTEALRNWIRMRSAWVNYDFNLARSYCRYCNKTFCSPDDSGHIAHNNGCFVGATVALLSRLDAEQNGGES